MKKVLFILAIAAFLFACERMKGNKLEGTYACTVVNYTWQMGSPGVSEYDTFAMDMNVVRHKDSLDIGSVNVPVSGVLDEQVYTYGGYHYSGRVQFKGDSLILYNSNLQGLGGGNESWKNCLKTK